jgi:hypothetical protein
MDDLLTSIQFRIADGTLLPASYYATMDRNAALDARDGDEFAAEWTRLFKEVERRWSEAPISAEARATAEVIRRESFLAVSRATGQHEIASYVSDDLDLIVRSRLLGMAEPLVTTLWDCYDRCRFPRPPFE